MPTFTPRRGDLGRPAIGVHAGLWVPDWTAASAQHAVTASSTLGFDVLEIPAVPTSTTDLSLTVGLLDDYGLDAVVSLALDRASDIHTDDPARSARGEERLTDAVAFAAAIGATYVGGVTYGAMTKSATRPSPGARENSLAVLRRVAARAADVGVRLGIEYVNRYESNFLNTAADAVRFVGELGADNVLVHLDTYHANVEEPSQASAVRDAGPLLGYVHAAENHRGALGTGSIDWDGLFDALADCDFRGVVTFESFSRAVQTDEMADDIGMWRDLWTDPWTTAAAAHAFLTDHLDRAFALTL